jgi:tetratricopeptide (TPR) repeat protein
MLLTIPPPGFFTNAFLGLRRLPNHYGFLFEPVAIAPSRHKICFYDDGKRPFCLRDSMAKRSTKRKVPRSVATAHQPKAASESLLSQTGVALLLGLATFLAYWPSLQSDFVYDARIEILREGFITSLSNLPDVLSFKVLTMNLMLGDRPGQLLYLMSIAAVCGKTPFGYHLCSNLLHAANVALLFVFLRRLAKSEFPALSPREVRRVQIAVAAVTLIFALHPLAVESVAAVNYSSDLLVLFFTLLALLAATFFNPENVRTMVIAGVVGTFCSFAAVTCKESGMATASLLIVYWFCFRRREAKEPWLYFLGAASAVTAAFLAVRFALAPPAPDADAMQYLGGSLSQVFLIQPRLWVFMMGKIIWPMPLSADYTLDDLNGLSIFVAMLILLSVLLLQTWLAMKSRIGVMGVAIYWLGLVTVSNFLPLYRPLGDRFYYLPMAGVAAQLLALVLMTLHSRDRFWLALIPCFVVLLPLTLLTVNREAVFANEYNLWSDTVQASPFSSIAQNGLGEALFDQGKFGEAADHFQKAVNLRPRYATGHNSLGNAFLQTGQLAEATAEYEKAIEINPRLPDAHNNLGVTLARQRRLDEAIAQFQQALALTPNYAEAHTNLGDAYLKKGMFNDAIAQFQAAVELKPDDATAQNDLANAQAMAKSAPAAK